MATVWREGEEVELPDAEVLLAPRPRYVNAEDAAATMVAWIEEFTNNVIGDVPLNEKLSWSTKEDAARAYVASEENADQKAMIDAEAAITGEAPLTLANTIIAKADLYRQIVANVAGLRRKTKAAIDAVTDPFDYETVLATAQAQANAMANALGLNGG